MAGLEGFTRFMAQAGSAEDVYGRRPVVPEFPSFSEALREITAGNLAALPSLKNLGIKSTKAYSAMMEAAYPGITDLKNLGTENIKSMLSGELPESVRDILKKYSAEYGVSSGTGGSGFAGAKGLRDLGLNQLQYTQEGLNSASRWIAQAQGQTFDFSKMFLGPQDAIRQAEGRFSRDWLAEQVRAAPDPTAKGKMDAEMAWIGMVLSIYSGGPGYQAKPDPNYGGTSQGGYGGGTGGGYSYFGGASGYGTTYRGEGGNMYQSVPTGGGGGMSVPYGASGVTGGGGMYDGWNSPAARNTFGPQEGYY